MKRLAVVFTLLFLVSPAFGEGSPIASLKVVDGRHYSGHITFSDGNFTITGKDTSDTVAGHYVDRIEFPKKIEIPDDLTHAVITLRDGQRYEGYFVELDVEDAIAFSLPECGVLTVPIESIAGIYFWGEPRIPSDEKAATIEFARKPPEVDELTLSNGDRVKGIVHSCGLKGVSIDSKDILLTYKRSAIRQVRFASPGEEKQFTHWHCRIRTTYGNLFYAVMQTIAEGRFKGELPFGTEVSLGLERVRSMTFRYGAAVYLADIKPQSVEEKPFFFRKRHYRLNRDIGGGTLKVAGVTYESGFGTHSFCRLNFKLDAAYSLLLTKVGIDDGANGLGSVEFKVIGDDRELYSSGVVKSGKMVDIKVDISGVNVLSLVSDFGGDDDIGDHANWCEPRLIRKVKQRE